jgi:hypothetical protein
MPTRLPRAVFPLALIVLLAVALASPARAQECPVAELQFNAGGIFTSDAAAYDTVASETEELAYDVPAGTLALRHEGVFSTFVRIHEAFLLTGGVTGTPVPVVLELVADGVVSSSGCSSSNCWGYLSATILAEGGGGLDRDGRNVLSGAQPIHLDLGAPMVFVAGVPQMITIELNAIGSAEHRVTGAATFHFTALPEGATITSCRGYVQAPTPVASATWGRVKAAYR